MTDKTKNPPRQTFPRKHKLPNEFAYKRVFAGAQTSRDKYFTILLRNNEGDGARLGIIAAKRKLPRAVDRNRAKRIIRESFRRNRDLLDASDVIVLAQAAAGGAENRILFESLDRHWRRCHELAGRD